MTVGLLVAALACLFAAGAVLEFLAAVPSRVRARASARASRQADQASALDVRWARARSADERAERLLDAAGRRSGVESADALRRRERTAMLLAAAWAGAVMLMLGGTVSAAVAAPVVGLAGRQLPSLLLRRAGAARAEVLRDEAPEVVALVAAAAGCGLPLDGMLATAGEWQRGELARGLADGARDLRRGAAPRHVLAAIQRDHPIEEVSALVAILERGRERGVPTAVPLKALAASARSARARRASDRAAKAGPRIQLVAALLLVPAALCMLAAAMVSGGLG